MKYRELDVAEISALESLGCSAPDWGRVKVAEGFDPERLRDVKFFGDVKLGLNGGTVNLDGLERPAGIERAVLADCVVGADVLIDNVSLVRGVEIGDGAAVVNCASIEAKPGAVCGHGVRVNAINEAGGREVTLHSKLSAQTAWLEAMCAHEREFHAALARLIAVETDRVKAAPVCVGSGARVLHCGPIADVAVGSGARVEGVRRLENGTVASDPDCPASIGSGVWAKDFIFAEGASIDSGATLEAVFAGQGARVGKGFSAGHALFFANAEAFNGEACSIFAGPFAVTHHKATLLIAGMFSFYNAGSATNQSNHMYKLGPCHQGIFERGCKTGSSSYVLEDAHVGAFTTVIGKHMTNINTPEMPFSFIVERGGESTLMPGIALQTVGLVRDAQKWPKRDRRPAAWRRDCVICDALSPYTVEKMRRGVALLEAGTHGGHFRGLALKDSMARQGVRLYRMAIARYLGDWIVTRLEKGLAAGRSVEDIQAEMRSPRPLKAPLEWSDVGGQLMPLKRLEKVFHHVAGGDFESVGELVCRFETMHEDYAGDEAAYVAEACREEWGAEPAAMTSDQLAGAIGKWRESSDGLIKKILADGAKEFSDASRIGYGADQAPAAAAADFEAVRSSAETNGVLAALRGELAALPARAEKLENAIVRP